jgi:hypothetical protein
MAGTNAITMRISSASHPNGTIGVEANLKEIKRIKMPVLLHFFKKEVRPLGGGRRQVVFWPVS